MTIYEMMFNPAQNYVNANENKILFFIYFIQYIL